MMDKETALNWFNKTNVLSRYSKFKREKQEVINQTDYLPKSASLPQRLWHIIHEITDIPGCKTCQKPVSWDRRFKRYKTYCGNPKCPNVDPDIISQKQSKTDYEKAAQKRHETCIKKYGHSNYLASEQGKQAVKRAFIAQTQSDKKKRYEKVANSRTKTLQDKYGVSNISHLAYISQDVLDLLNNKEWLKEQHHTLRKSAKQIGEELHIKSASSVIRSYLEKYQLQTLDVRLTPDTLNLLNNKDWLKEQHHDLKKSQSLIASELDIKGGATVVGKYLRKHGIEVLNPHPTSIGEQQIAEWLVNNKTAITQNCRSTIAPYELDIYIPQHNLAIEYCGLYWHSEQNGKDKWYHHNKWKRCKEQGIQLLTIYEDEWQQQQQQVKQKLLSLLNKDQRERVYARKCKIVVVSKKQKQEFFNQHHIQQDGPSSINIGLEYNDELVAVVGFYKQQDKHYLNRYATSKQVIGGFSKLLKYFQHNYEWNTLISFADLRWSTGNLYAKTGWTLDDIIPPDYYYSPNGHDRYHKFNYRRKNLPKILNHFNPNMSEKQNCDVNNILRLWDCGKLRYVISNN